MGDTSSRSSLDTQQADQSSQKDRSQSPKRSEEGDRSRSPKGDRSQHSRSPDFAAEPRFQPWYEASKRQLEEKFGKRFRENLPKDHYDQMKQELQEEFNRNMELLPAKFSQRMERTQKDFQSAHDKVRSVMCDKFEELKKEIESGLKDALRYDTEKILKKHQKELIKLMKAQQENPKGEREHSKDIKKVYSDLLSEKEPYKIRRDKISKDLMNRIENAMKSMKVIEKEDSDIKKEENPEYSGKGLEATNKWKIYIESIDGLKEEYKQMRSKPDEKYDMILEEAIERELHYQEKLSEDLSHANLVLDDLKKHTTQNT